MALDIASGVAALSMITYGFSEFFAKLVIHKLGSYRTLLFSAIIGYLPLAAITLLLSRLGTPSLEALIYAAASGFIGIFSFLFFLKALNLGKISLVSPIASCYSIVTIILSILVLGETLSWAEALAILGVFTGIVMMSTTRQKETSVGDRRGIVYAIGSMLAAGVYVIFLKAVVIRLGDLAGLFYVRMFMIIYLSSVYPLVKQTLPRQTLKKREKLLISGVGLTDTFAFYLYLISLNIGEVSIVTPISGGYPLVTLLLARAFLKERVQAYQAFGISIVIISVAILSMGF